MSENVVTTIREILTIMLGYRDREICGCDQFVGFTTAIRRCI